MSEGLVCITCPLGCHLDITRQEGGGIAVSGNRCPRGVKYAEEELLAPKRMVSATARINPARLSGSLGSIARLPVRSTAAFAKENVMVLLDAIYALNVELPVRRGDVLIRDFQGSGVNVIATRTILATAASFGRLTPVHKSADK